MKKLLILIGVLNAYMGLQAQQFDKNSNTLSSLVNIDLATGIVEEVNSSLNRDKIDVKIQNGDVIILFDLAQINKEEFYEVVPILLLNGKIVPISKIEDLRGDFGNITRGGPKQISWIQPLESFNEVQGKLEVLLNVTFWSKKNLPWDCSLGEPFFNRSPYYILAGVGLASMGAGQLFKAQSDKIYQNDYEPAKTNEIGAPFYDKANNNHHTYLILTYTGAAILLADATLFLIRQGKYRADMKRYRASDCESQKISIKPFLELPSSSSPLGVAGLSFQLSF